MKWMVLVAAFFGFAAVALGAFGAHALRDVLDPKQLEIYETAVKYQFYHAIVLLVVSLFARLQSDVNLRRACLSFVFGILVFSGSLYLLVFTGVKKLGMVTPIGGVSLMLGWLFLMAYGYRAAQKSLQ